MKKPERLTALPWNLGEATRSPPDKILTVSAAMRIEPTGCFERLPRFASNEPGTERKRYRSTKARREQSCREGGARAL
jgi:hypothetical protein